MFKRVRAAFLVGISAALSSLGDSSSVENFDGVTAPALPYGWVATNAQGPDPLWVADITHSSSSPNAAHIDDPQAVADKRLDSPPILVTTSAAQLSFRQWGAFSYHFVPCTPPFCGGVPDGVGYWIALDGGVLEISINGSEFEDIIDAGGSFVSGGYTDVLSSQDNPLNARNAWGVSLPYNVFSTTSVDLPPSAAGTIIVLRWRMGSGSEGSDTPPTGWWIDDVQICDGYACNAVPLPERLDVDTAGNEVWEPGENVDVDPYYYNNGDISLVLDGSATNLTGPAGATYTIVNSSASYGLIDPGYLGGCSFTTDCYVVSADNPPTRPAQHWDAQFSEVLSNMTAATFALHIGGSFTDVTPSTTFYRFIETVFHRGVTGGCGGTNYCPGDPALRKQMAVFLLKSKYGATYVPPAANGIFADVPASDSFAPWIEQLYNLGITGGCSSSPLQYCPGAAVLREQMAVFLLKTLLGSGYVPPPCTGVFTDVPCPSLFADWIEDLSNRQIAAGCGTGGFCPTIPNTRSQMAAFLVKTFGLRLYGP